MPHHCKTLWGALDFAHFNICAIIILFAHESSMFHKSNKEILLIGLDDPSMHEGCAGSKHENEKAQNDKQNSFHFTENFFLLFEKGIQIVAGLQSRNLVFGAIDRNVRCSLGHRPLSQTKKWLENAFVMGNGIAPAKISNTFVFPTLHVFACSIVRCQRRATHKILVQTQGWKLVRIEFLGWERRRNVVELDAARDWMCSTFTTSVPMRFCARLFHPEFAVSIGEEIVVTSKSKAASNSLPQSGYIIWFVTLVVPSPATSGSVEATKDYMHHHYLTCRSRILLHCCWIVLCQSFWKWLLNVCGFQHVTVLISWHFISLVLPPHEWCCPSWLKILMGPM